MSLHLTEEGKRSVHQKERVIYTTPKKVERDARKKEGEERNCKER